MHVVLGQKWLATYAPEYTDEEKKQRMQDVYLNIAKNNDPKSKE